MKINRNFFLKSSIFLILLRSPIVLLTMVGYLLVNNKIIVFFLSRMLPFLISILIFVIYSLHLGNNQAEIFGQVRDIILALTVAFLLISSVKANGSNIVCYNTIKICFIMVAVGKICLLFYSILTGIGLNTLIKQITEVWGIQMMTLSSEGSSVGRIQIPIDSVVPYFLYFYTKEVFERSKSKLDLLYFLLLCFSMLLTFSRVMWAQTLLFVLMSICIELRLRTKIRFFAITSIVAFFIIIFTPFGDTILSIVNSRLGSDNNINQASDIQRTIQNHGLWLEISKKPLFGHGIGYYIPTLIRSSEVKYLYESQGLSMIMTLGYIGVLLFLILISTYVILLNNKKIIPWGCFFFITFWIFCGCYNPYLFGASGGLILYLTSEFYRIKNMLTNES